MPRTTLGFSRFPVSPTRARVEARARQRALRRQPGFDALEGQQLLSGVFTVSNTNDSGPGSLRASASDNPAGEDHDHSFMRLEVLSSSHL
jgi:hypothetical protein